MKNKTILIAAAHPDDEILGCGGTIAKLTRNDENTVYTLILGEGITSRKDIGYIKNKMTGTAVGTLYDEIRIDSLKAQEILGVRECYFEDFPDNMFDSVALLEIVKKVDKYIDKIKPDVIFTHHPSDLNIDHRITFQAVLTCCRPQPNFKHPDIYCFEIPSSTEWQYLTGETSFKPNVFVDVSDTIDLKIEALKCYTSEMKEYPHSRSLQGVLTMAQDWGRKVGRIFVEAFELIRSVRNEL